MCGMKKFLCFVSMVVVLISVCGCKTTYIDDSKKTEQNTIMGTKEEVEEETYGNNTGLSMSAFAVVKYLSDENDTFVQEQKSEYIINKGLNCAGVSINCQVNEVLPWKDISARIYVIDNGIPIPFLVDDSEACDIYADIDYSVGEMKDIVVKFEQEQLSSQNGMIDILIYFNPDEQAGEWSGQYSGMVAYAFNYINDDYTGEVDKVLEPYKGEYLQIPNEYIDNACTSNIGDADLYNNEYMVKRYENNIIQCSSLEELFIYWNSGRNSAEDVLVGLIVDGELKKISGEDYFIRVEQKKGTQTFKYPLDVLGELEKGEHTFTLIGFREDLGFIPENRWNIVIN